MKYAVKLSTLKSTIADAHIGPYAPIDDKYALKIREALVKAVNEYGETELVKIDNLDITSEGAYQYLSDRIFCDACKIFNDSIRGFNRIVKGDISIVLEKLPIDYDNIAYLAIRNASEGIPYNKVQSQNGIYTYEA